MNNFVNQGLHISEFELMDAGQNDFKIAEKVR